MAPILITLLYILFVLAAIVLIVVVLLQEGKGGGFGAFLGEGGQQTFGVGAKGINTFTGYTAGIFLVSALVLHALNVSAGTGSVLDGLDAELSTPGQANNFGLGGLPGDPNAPGGGLPTGLPTTPSGG